MGPTEGGWEQGDNGTPTQLEDRLLQEISPFLPTTLLALDVQIIVQVFIFILFLIYES